MTRKEIYKSRFRSLNTAEKKRILSRLFPDGYIESKDNIPDEQTFAGYTEDYGLIEVRFSLFDSRIDISREFETEREKWLFINDIKQGTRQEQCLYQASAEISVRQRLLLLRSGHERTQVLHRTKPKQATSNLKRYNYEKEIHIPLPYDR